MPDLREDLGRLADGVGEPVGLDDLAAARRRRERRRRTAGFAGGFAVLVLGALIAVQLSEGGRPVTAPGDSNTLAPTANAIATIWPENAVNGGSPTEVQASLDGGDETLRWRTDPGRVVERFGQAVLGRDMRVLSVDTEDVGSLVRAFPCLPGEQSIGLSCDVIPDDPMTFRLVQPGTKGADGIWSIVSVTSPPLGIKGLGDVGSTISEGAEITFDVFMFENPTTAHLGIVISNGCDVVDATKDVTVDGRHTLQVPSVGDAAPSCAADPTGYVYVYVTDDTTLPSWDPINDPTAIEYPWITIVPISLEATGASSTTAPTDEPTVSETPGPSATPPASEGVPIPTDLAPASDASCPNVPATEVDIFLKGLQLVGCGRWASGGNGITVTFEVADAGVAAGLMLFQIEQCAAGLCEGDPAWEMKVDSEPRMQFHVGPLDAGTYVLVDPVHPTTAAMLVEAS